MLKKKFRSSVRQSNDVSNDVRTMMILDRSSVKFDAILEIEEIREMLKKLNKCDG